MHDKQLLERLLNLDALADTIKEEVAKLKMDLGIEKSFGSDKKRTRTELIGKGL